MKITLSQLNALEDLSEQTELTDDFVFPDSSQFNELTKTLPGIVRLFVSLYHASEGIDKCNEKIKKCKKYVNDLRDTLYHLPVIDDDPVYCDLTPYLGNDVMLKTDPVPKPMQDGPETVPVSDMPEADLTPDGSGSPEAVFTQDIPEPASVPAKSVSAEDKPESAFPQADIDASRISVFKEPEPEPVQNEPEYEEPVEEKPAGKKISATKAQRITDKVNAMNFSPENDFYPTREEVDRFLSENTEDNLAFMIWMLSVPQEKLTQDGVKTQKYVRKLVNERVDKKG